MAPFVEVLVDIAEISTCREPGSLTPLAGTKAEEALIGTSQPPVGDAGDRDGDGSMLRECLDATYDEMGLGLSGMYCKLQPRHRCYYNDRHEQEESEVAWGSITQALSSRHKAVLSMYAYNGVVLANNGVNLDLSEDGFLVCERPVLLMLVYFAGLFLTGCYVVIRRKEAEFEDIVQTALWIFALFVSSVGVVAYQMFYVNERASDIIAGRRRVGRYAGVSKQTQIPAPREMRHLWCSRAPQETR